MIVSWKKVSALEFVARWEGQGFQLLWSPGEHRWEVWVDGARTNRRFASANAAMDAVEDSLNRTLVELGRLVQATQRPSSRDHIVVHSVSGVSVFTQTGHIGSRRSNFASKGGRHASA